MQATCSDILWTKRRRNYCYIGKRIKNTDNTISAHHIHFISVWISIPTRWPQRLSFTPSLESTALTITVSDES